MSPGGSEHRLPAFPYHPDPLATGSVVPSEVECVACGRSRGFIYVGPVFSVEELDESLCPWCIADGSAAASFGATFTDDWGASRDVPAEVVVQVTQRTPGFTGWQQERWMYHCGDGCAFLGRVGNDDLRRHPDALESLRHEHDGVGWTTAQVDEYLGRLDPDQPPTAYLFRCRGCQAHLAYSDFT